MAVFDNMNYSYSNGVAPGIVDYYERTLLENAKPEMVHARDAQKRTLPANNGKRVQFRRMTPFAPITTPLSEGVTPAGQTLTQTALWAMVKPYGAHVELTDELDMYHLDNLHCSLPASCAWYAVLCTQRYLGLPLRRTDCWYYHGN